MSDFYIKFPLVCLFFWQPANAQPFSFSVNTGRGQSENYQSCVVANLPNKDIPFSFGVFSDNRNGRVQVPDGFGGTLSLNIDLRYAVISAFSIFNSDKLRLQVVDHNRSIPAPGKNFSNLIMVNAEVNFGPELLSTSKKNNVFNLVFGGGKGSTSSGNSRLDESSVYQTGFNITFSKYVSGEIIRSDNATVDTISSANDRSVGIHIPNLNISRQRRGYVNEGTEKGLFDAVLLNTVTTIATSLYKVPLYQMDRCNEMYFDGDEVNRNPDRSVPRSRAVLTP